jgi:hypothetical protein
MRMLSIVGGMVVGLVALWVAWPCEAVAAESGGGEEKRGQVIYNLDCTQYFMGSFGPIVPETIDKFVEEHAAAGITDLWINVNAQRTNYRSDVWEAFWDGYDPAAGTDQPFFSGMLPRRIDGPDANDAAWFIRMYKLHDQGCDYPQRMLESARRNRLGAWLSMRMNDGHHPELPNHPGHSTIWKTHPEWWLTSGYGLDYEQEEVREHHLKLVRELCERYDIDGLELDFQRFWLYFRPGREHQGAKLMLDFMEQARAATRGAAQRLGHPVKLAVRVPGNPWTARRHGLDAVAWARAGLVDLIVAGSFWFSTNSDIPVETWKGQLIGTGVEVAVHLEDGINSGASGRRTMTPDEMRGLLISALHRGADAVYLFNLFTGPYQRWPREEHDRLISDAGSYDALRAAPRRHVLTITDPWSKGEAGSHASLPYTGKHGTFRLYTGPKPSPKQETQVELIVPDNQTLEVRMNGISCPGSVLVEPTHIKASGLELEMEMEPRQAFRVPPEAMSDGYNLIEVLSAQEATIKWVEISVR